jgi:hypothetical protein
MPWIKMRTDLRDDPAVIGIADILGIEEDTVVGKLHRLWSWADSQTFDGKADNVKAAWIDRYLGREGFADALVTVGWLEISDAGIAIPNFERHNGETAKKRALTAKRVAKHKSNTNADSVSEALPTALPRGDKSIARKDHGNGSCVTNGDLYCEETRLGDGRAPEAGDSAPVNCGLLKLKDDTPLEESA